MDVDPWALSKLTMDSLPSVWTSHHESVGELLHKLLCATWELEALQSSIEEERREREENMNQLIQILKVTTQERDEAREQLHFLLDKISEPNNLAELVHALSLLHPDCPQIWHPRGNNSIVMESESPSETPNLHPYGSSPAESFFVSSMKVADSCTMGLPQQPVFLRENNHSCSMGISPGTAKYDRADAIIDMLSARRPLPEKGKLLEAMMKTGPMLDTLMVAGLLPHWRNPPPLQSFQVPPVTIKACYSQLRNRAAVLNSNHSIQSYLCEKSDGSSIFEFSGMMSLYRRTLPGVSSYQGFEARREGTP